MKVYENKTFTLKEAGEITGISTAKLVTWIKRFFIIPLESKKIAKRKHRYTFSYFNLFEVALLFLLSDLLSRDYGEIKKEIIRIKYGEGEYLSNMILSNAISFVEKYQDFDFKTFVHNDSIDRSMKKLESKFHEKIKENQNIKIKIDIWGSLGIKEEESDNFVEIIIDTGKINNFLKSRIKKENKNV
jgi:hypothetical protein